MHHAASGDGAIHAADHHAAGDLLRKAERVKERIVKEKKKKKIAVRSLFALFAPLFSLLAAARSHREKLLFSSDPFHSPREQVSPSIFVVFRAFLCFVYF